MIPERRKKKLKFNNFNKSAVLMLICGIVAVTLGVVIIFNFESQLVASIIDDSVNLMKSNVGQENMETIVQFRKNNQLKVQTIIVRQVWVALIIGGLLAAVISLIVRQMTISCGKSFLLWQNGRQSFANKLDNDNKWNNARELLQSIFDHTQWLKQTSAKISSAAIPMDMDIRRVFTEVAPMLNIGSIIQTANERIETVTEAMAQLALTIDKMVQQSENIFTIAEDLIARINSASAKTDKLEKLVQKIQSVMSQMDQISAQIDLLVLNATIESDSAEDTDMDIDEAAYKIKMLARQTVTAAKKITSNIGVIQHSTLRSPLEISLILKIITKIRKTASDTAETLNIQSIEIKKIITILDQTSHDFGEKGAFAIQEPTAEIMESSSHQDSNFVHGDLAHMGSQIKQSACQIEDTLLDLKYIINQFHP
ncbi:MAG: hypothetical protein PVI90_19275 [Desulfobacteraceae bacterium]|jgi:methyl-accepting chemotaxis protein